MSLAVALAACAGFALGSLWRLWSRPRVPHEPRAVRLRLTSGHRCEYVETMWGEDVLSLCVTCSRPPPTSLGERRPR